jgi:hypothetical protein
MVMSLLIFVLAVLIFLSGDGLTGIGSRDR